MKPAAAVSAGERRASIRPRVRRVLYLASSLHYGGAERQIVELARHLDRSRFEPMLCCLDGVTTLAASLGGAVPLTVVRKHHRFDFTVVPRLVRLIGRERIDIVHTFLFDAEIAGRIAGRLAGVAAVVASERNSSYPRMPLHDAALKLTRPLFDLMIANSHAGRRFNLERLNAAPALVTVVHNGVDVERFRPRDASGLRRSLEIPANAPVVGMFASFKPQKNHAMFVRVARLVSDARPDARFLLVAHNPSCDPVSRKHRDGILASIEAAGLAGRFVHLLDRTDMENLYSLCDVTVLTSVREGTPNVVLESMASGVPVIATDVADNARIIADAGGVVPLNDDAGMSERLIRLLGDPIERSRLGFRARRRAECEFSLDALARKTEQAYEQALARRRALRLGLSPRGTNGTTRWA